VHSFSKIIKMALPWFFSLKNRKPSLLLLHHQDRAGGLADDPFGGGAQQQSAEAGAAVAPLPGWQQHMPMNLNSCIPLWQYRYQAGGWAFF
jgi:hypothetical protein